MIAAITLPSALAAKEATSTIPIVFYSGGDPVEEGLVTSFSRPGGNLTGISLFLNTLGPKRLELIRELVPNAAVIGLLINPSNPNAEPQAKAAQQVARAIGQQLKVLSADSEDDLDAAFAILAKQRLGALRRRRSILRQPARSARCAGGAARGSRSVRRSRVRKGRWLDQLWQ